MPRATQDTATLHAASCTRLSRSMEELSRTFHSRHFLRSRGPTTPTGPEPCRFGLLPVRSPLLGESLTCFLFLRVLRCFSSPGWPPPCGCRAVSPAGCPIRRSADQRSFAPTRGFSQLVTSFIACKSQGIRHTPFPTFFRSSSAGSGGIAATVLQHSRRRQTSCILSAVLVKSSFNCNQICKSSFSFFPSCQRTFPALAGQAGCGRSGE